MSLWKCFVMAMDSIMSSKMKSFLTMLGIIIGVTAVVALMSLMSGLTDQVLDLFADLGTNTISVSIQSRATTKQLKPEDMYAFMEEHSDLISAASPNISVRGKLKVGTEDTSNTTITGVDESYIDKMNSAKVEFGRGLQYIDIKRHQRVCVVGTYVAKNFFGSVEQALGQSVKINSQSYTIVGVLEEKADSEERSTDDKIFIPYTCASKLNNSNVVNSYSVAAVDEDHADQASALLNELLDKKIGDSKYYYVMSMKELIDEMNTMTSMMSGIMGAIAGLSLLVGGIGIMNIMLVSVTERTREIGIRKSLGAKHKDIMNQFIIESATISCIGGIIGVIIGSIITIVTGKLLSMDASPSFFAVCLAFGVSVGIGIIFGITPAKKAAELNPIDALRQE